MTDYLDDAMNEVAATVASGDKLDTVRAAVCRLRELEYERQTLEERLTKIKGQILELTDRELVKLFSEAHMTTLELEAEGNYPAIVASKTSFYNAKIPDEKEAEAFAWFHDNGHGDLIKTQITAQFGMGERENAERVEASLSDAGVDYNSKVSVHASTLKAFVKSEIEAGRALPMDLLGVYMGETVKIKTSKGK